MNWFRKTKIDSFFLETKCPYTQRRPIKTKSVIILVGIGALIFVGYSLYLGMTSTPSIEESASSSTNDEKKEEVKASEDQTGVFSSLLGQERPNALQNSAPSPSIPTTGAVSASNRNYSANQVIRRGEQGTDPGSHLPKGTLISARLINAISSTDSASPVIALIPEDVFAQEFLSIPAGTKVYGQATFDSGSQRLRLSFDTLVYPDSTQHGIQALGMMEDGSAGIQGDFHSGGAKKRIGRLMGNFIGGLADGMKDRTASGQGGMPYEIGSIKNGLLNGVTISAQDEAKSFSDDLSSTKPYMNLTSGQSFLLFLEREYLP